MVINASLSSRRQALVKWLVEVPVQLPRDVRFRPVPAGGQGWSNS